MKEKTIVEKNIAFVEAIREAGRDKEAKNLLHMKPQDYGLTDKWEGGFTSDLLTSIYVAAQLEKLSLPPLTTENLVEFFSFLLREEAQKKEAAKPGTFKISEHIANAALVKGITRANEIESLDRNIKENLEASKELEKTIEGIQVTAPEYELILVLAKLNDENFEGMVKSESIPGLRDQEGVALLGNTKKYRDKSCIVITPYELAKEYKGGKEPTSAEIKGTEKRLYSLANKKQLIRIKSREYTSPKYTKNKKGWEKNKAPQYTDHTIQFYEPLYKIVDYTSETPKVRQTEDQATATVKREAKIIWLSFVFNEDFENYFIKAPNDFRTKNIEIGNKSLAFTKLQTFLLRQLKYKYHKDEILIDTLILTIAPEIVRRSRAQDTIFKALEDCKKLGLLESYTIEKNAKGKDKLIYKLNKNYL